MKKIIYLAWFFWVFRLSIMCWKSRDLAGWSKEQWFTNLCFFFISVVWHVWCSCLVCVLTWLQLLYWLFFSQLSSQTAIRLVFFSVSSFLFPPYFPCPLLRFQSDWQTIFDFTFLAGFLWYRIIFLGQIFQKPARLDSSASLTTWTFSRLSVYLVDLKSTRIHHCSTSSHISISVCLCHLGIANLKAHRWQCAAFIGTTRKALERPLIIVKRWVVTPTQTPTHPPPHTHTYTHTHRG